MDIRIREHAEVIADHSAAIEPGDDVIIRAPTSARDLVIALHEAIGERDANPATSWVDSRAHRAYMLAADADSFDLPNHVLAFIDTADVYIDINASENSYEKGDIPAERQAAFAQAIEPLKQAIMDTRWVYTQFPAAGPAQKAEMSTEAYEEFVWNAINKDWTAQAEFQQQFVDILRDGSEIHIQSGERTDLRLSISGNIVKNSTGRHNLPDGEVSTAPIPESVEGTIHFDYPALVRGKELRGVELRFEAGTVVEYSAEKNESALGNLLDTDAGARRLGELGFGMNRDIDQFTFNMLFDEKMGDTIHVALGSAYEDTVADGNEQNDSAIHVDLLVDMSTNSTISIDDTIVQNDGRFVFEDGFQSP